MIPSRQYSIQLRTLMLAGRFWTISVITCLLSFVLAVLPLHNENATAIFAGLTMGSLGFILVLMHIMYYCSCAKVVEIETKHWTVRKQLIEYFFPWWPWITQRIHRGK